MSCYDQIGLATTAIPSITMSLSVIVICIAAIIFVTRKR